MLGHNNIDWGGLGMQPDIICANGVFCADGKVLLTRESKNTAYYFPGGKVGVGETLTQTLQRELKEELSLVVSPDRFKWAFTHRGAAYNQPGKIVELNCFLVTGSGALKVDSEVYDYKWCRPDDSRIAEVVREALARYSWVVE